MTKTNHSILLLVIIVAIAGFGAWFWSLGNVKAVDNIPTSRLLVTQEIVELKRQGQTDWKTVSGEIQIKAGDEVKTNAQGRAEIHWGERGITRIDPDTDVIIESAPDQDHYITNVSIVLRLQSGRVWSRMLKLLDLESEVSVHTDDVVATVRGTAFGVRRGLNGTEVLVTESKVAVRGANETQGNEKIVSKGQLGAFNKTAVAVQAHMRELTAQDTWANDNDQADHQYDEELKTRMRKRLQDTERTGARSSLLARASERLHLKLAGENDLPLLEGGYIREHLANPDTLGETWDQDLSALNRLQGRHREQVLADIEARLFIDGTLKPDTQEKMHELRRQTLREHVRPELEERDIQPAQPEPPLTENPTPPLPENLTRPTEPLTPPIKLPLNPPPTITNLTPIAPIAPEFVFITNPSVGLPDTAMNLAIFAVFPDRRVNITDHVIFALVDPTDGIISGHTFTPTVSGQLPIKVTGKTPDGHIITKTFFVNVGVTTETASTTSPTINAR